MGPILVYEQDFVHIDNDDGAVLDMEYVKGYCSYFITDQEGEVPSEDIAGSDEFSAQIDYEDEHLIIIQAFNSEGESWKFIQSR